ncbi:MAG TPA: hypothetical protein VHZ07_00270 [Bryobacteraceae bacterium]|jgi:hypothetical protein|nr:hypothetical protein [Bryobacteraceae bacterium]
MMTYDPYQTYPALGQYYGITAPIGSPYAGLQTSALNPAALINPLAAALGVTSNPLTGGNQQVGQSSYPGFSAQGGINPQQLQLASLLASQTAIPQLLGMSPWATGLTNPMLAATLHNNIPLLAAILQNPQLNPILAAAIHSTGSQFGSQFGYQPNSMYGQGGSPYGQQTGSPFGQAPSQYGQQFGSPFGQSGSQYGQQFGSPFGQSGSQYGQQTGSPFGQMGSPYGQIGSQLAPQSWIGQGGPFGGQQFGQGNPLQSQFGARPFQTSGISPWGY